MDDETDEELGITVPSDDDLGITVPADEPAPAPPAPAPAPPRGPPLTGRASNRVDTRGALDRVTDWATGRDPHAIPDVRGSIEIGGVSAPSTASASRAVGAARAGHGVSDVLSALFPQASRPEGAAGPDVRDRSAWTRYGTSLPAIGEGLDEAGGTLGAILPHRPWLGEVADERPFAERRASGVDEARRMRRLADEQADLPAQAIGMTATAPLMALPLAPGLTAAQRVAQTGLIGAGLGLARGALSSEGDDPTDVLLDAGSAGATEGLLSAGLAGAGETAVPAIARAGRWMRGGGLTETAARLRNAAGGARYATEISQIHDPVRHAEILRETGISRGLQSTGAAGQRGAQVRHDANDAITRLVDEANEAASRARGGLAAGNAPPHMLPPEPMPAPSNPLLDALDPLPALRTRGGAVGAPPSARVQPATAAGPMTPAESRAVGSAYEDAARLRREASGGGEGAEDLIRQAVGRERRAQDLLPLRPDPRIDALARAPGHGPYRTASMPQEPPLSRWVAPAPSTYDRGTLPGTVSIDSLSSRLHAARESVEGLGAPARGARAEIDRLLSGYAESHPDGNIPIDTVMGDWRAFGDSANFREGRPWATLQQSRRGLRDVFRQVMEEAMESASGPAARTELGTSLERVHAGRVAETGAERWIARQSGNRILSPSDYFTGGVGASVGFSTGDPVAGVAAAGGAALFNRLMRGREHALGATALESLAPRLRAMGPHLQRAAQTLEGAMRRGRTALAIAHASLQRTDPSYRRAIEEMDGSDDHGSIEGE